MKRILFIIPSAYPQGGVQDWFDYIYKETSSQYEQVVAGIVSAKFHNVARYLDQHNIDNYIEIKNPTGSKYGRVKSLIATINDLQPDVVVNINIADVYDAIAQLKKEKKFKGCFVTVLHGFQFRFIKTVSVFHNVIDGVIVTNKLTEALINNISNIDKERILYAPYGVPVPEKNEKNANPELVISYVGRLDQVQKMVHDISRIVQELKRQDANFKFLIAGDGSEFKQLQASLADEIEKGEVVMLGWLNHSQLVERVYRTTDILLLTSLWETGPIIAWEAMSYGIPIVSARYIGSRSENTLRHKENCLLFNIGDTKQAASLIIYLSKNEELRSKIIKSAYEMYLENYTLDKSVEKFRQSLERIFSLDQVSGQVSYKWPTSGKLTRAFGHRIADQIRFILGWPEHMSSGGDEWPHANQTYSVEEYDQYLKLVCELEKIPIHLIKKLKAVDL